MKAPNLLGGSVVIGLANVMANVMNAPTWAVVTIIVLSLICVLVLGVLQLVMPQESQDKRLLLEKVLEYKERCRVPVPAKKTRQRRAIRASPEQNATVAPLPRSAALTEQTPARSTARSP
ncbi:hypothetical protein DMB66_13945 [Actinoplanes sp. ATCC 53533]|uniref:hypothetical protein n=1 Tax=Actinoplanes sp. ATCC 53533 TaxID=1288362 RepID=UPI000F778A66|nr:hypothetical protein [Actinoplanes sp. ATCC 53533]RSM68169.1 hypothetical protein DMB66_13945 [Actinoplanes sp. ATCC 53533]